MTRINAEPRTFNFAGSCFLVQPFRIALFHDVEGRIDEDFDKVETGILVDLTSKRAISAVGRDERGQRYTRGVRKQARDLSSRRPPKNDIYGKAAKGEGGKGLDSEGRTSPILRMFSLRDFSSNPRSLFRPKRTLSPSNL